MRKSKHWRLSINDEFYCVITPEYIESKDGKQITFDSEISIFDALILLNRYNKIKVFI